MLKTLNYTNFNKQYVSARILRTVVKIRSLKESMNVNTETFREIKTAKDLDKATAEVVAVVDAYCKQVSESKTVRFAHCEACPFYSSQKDDCLKYFMHKAINEQAALGE